MQYFQYEMFYDHHIEYILGDVSAYNWTPLKWTRKGRGFSIVLHNFVKYEEPTGRSFTRCRVYG